MTALIRRWMAARQFERTLDRKLAAKRAARMNGQVMVRPHTRRK